MTDKKVVLFIGETGAGKSSTINSIFGREVASPGKNAWSCTEKSKLYELDDGKCMYHIWDTPILELYEICKDIVTIVKKENRIDVIFLVYKLRITEHLLLCYKVLTTVLFDMNVCKNMVLLRTDFEEFTNRGMCETQTSGVKLMPHIRERMSHLISEGQFAYVENKLDPVNSRNVLLRIISESRGTYIPDSFDNIVSRMSTINFTVLGLPPAQMKGLEEAVRKLRKETLESKLGLAPKPEIFNTVNLNGDAIVAQMIELESRIQHNLREKGLVIKNNNMKMCSPPFSNPECSDIRKFSAAYHKFKEFYDKLGIYVLCALPMLGAALGVKTAAELASLYNNDQRAREMTNSTSDELIHRLDKILTICHDIDCRQELVMIHAHEHWSPLMQKLVEFTDELNI